MPANAENLPLAILCALANLTFTSLAHAIMALNSNSTRRYGASVHFGVVVVELINCKCGGIVKKSNMVRVKCEIMGSVRILGSLSNSVFERRTSTGSGLFASLGSSLVETLG